MNPRSAPGQCNVCDQRARPTTIKCFYCNEYKYCSMTCREEDSIVHFQLCRGLVRADRAGSSLGAQAVSPDDNLRAQLRAMYSANNALRCDNCNQAIQLSINKCPYCQEVEYCSSACRTRDVEHFGSCNGLIQAISDSARTSSRCSLDAVIYSPSGSLEINHDVPQPNPQVCQPNTQVRQINTPEVCQPNPPILNRGELNLPALDQAVPELSAPVVTTEGQFWPRAAIPRQLGSMLPAANQFRFIQRPVIPEQRGFSRLATDNGELGVRNRAFIADDRSFRTRTFTAEECDIRPRTSITKESRIRTRTFAAGRGFRLMTPIAEERCFSPRTFSSEGRGLKPSVSFHNSGDYCGVNTQHSGLRPRTMLSGHFQPMMIHPRQFWRISSPFQEHASPRTVFPEDGFRSRFVRRNALRHSVKRDAFRYLVTATECSPRPMQINQEHVQGSRKDLQNEPGSDVTATEGKEETKNI